MRFIQFFRALAAQETPAQRRHRMLPSALYGLAVAATYTLVGATINQLSHPDLPISVDWRNLLGTGILLAAWLALGGLLTNWFTYTEESMMFGVPIMIVGLLVLGLFLTDGGFLQKISASALSLLILPGCSIPMTLLLRWLGTRHADLLERSQSVRWRGIAGLALIAILLGALLGLVLTRWNDFVSAAARDMHTRLHNAAAEPAKLNEIFPIEQTPGLAEHLTMPYTLRARPSKEFVVAYDVTVGFTDGYQMTCVLLIFSSEQPFLRACAEGEYVTLPPNE